MKDYLSFEGLSHFLNKLSVLFAKKSGYGSNKYLGTDESGNVIEKDAMDLIVTDDNEGNVNITLPTVASIVTSDNDILTVGDESD